MNTHHRDCLRICRHVGRTDPVIEHSGTHLRVRCAEGFVVMPCTPSDGRRWRHNAAAAARGLKARE